MLTSTGTPDPTLRRGYHHGDLKQALMNVAEDLLAEKGPAGFTLADAARRAGVSPAAPYRHFPDREALLAEVARRGFQEFATRLAATLNAEATGPGGFSGMGTAYLAFAQERPGAYAAMFNSPARQIDAALQQTGSDAFQLLVAGISRAYGRQAPPGADMTQLALQIWAVSHGVATLAASGRMQGILGSSPEAVLTSAVSALIEGAKPG